MASTTQENEYTEYEEDIVATPPPQKLGGVIFWLVAGLAITKDLVIDPLFDLLVGFGLTLSTTFVLAIAGLPFAAMSWVAGLVVSITIWVILQTYFIMHGGLHASAKIERFVVWFFAIACGMIPVLKQLPETTILFFFIAWLENAIRKDNLVAHALRIAIERKG